MVRIFGLCRANWCGFLVCLVRIGADWCGFLLLAGVPRRLTCHTLLSGSQLILCSASASKDQLCHLSLMYKVPKLNLQIGCVCESVVIFDSLYNSILFVTCYQGGQIWFSA